MKMCMDHWNKLREAIKARGLDTLVSESGQDAVKKMVREASEGPSVDSFEPLMGAHNAILANALNAGGIALLMQEKDGTDRCPICFLKEQVCSEHGVAHPEIFEPWIDRAADDQVEIWKKLGEASA